MTNPEYEGFRPDVESRTRQTPDGRFFAEAAGRIDITEDSPWSGYRFRQLLGNLEKELRVQRSMILSLAKVQLLVEDGDQQVFITAPYHPDGGFKEGSWYKLPTSTAEPIKDEEKPASQIMEELDQLQSGSVVMGLRVGYDSILLKNPLETPNCDALEKARQLIEYNDNLGARLDAATKVLGQTSTAELAGIEKPAEIEALGEAFKTYLN